MIENLSRKIHSDDDSLLKEFLFIKISSTKQVDKGYISTVFYEAYVSSVSPFGETVKTNFHMMSMCHVSYACVLANEIKLEVS